MSLVPSRAGQDAEKPEHITGARKDLSEADLHWIARQFQIGELAFFEPFRERGNINLATYLARNAEGHEFLLQRINTDVFKQPYRVMRAMQDWINAQEAYFASGKAPDWTIWEPVRLVPTVSEEPFLDISDSSGWSVWRMMTKISNGASYRSLSVIPDPEERLRMAEEIGRGLALNSDLTSQMKLDDLVSSLPGYRDTVGYYNQFHSVAAGHRELGECEMLLPTDAEVRESTQDLYVVALDSDEELRRKTEPDVADAILLIVNHKERALSLAKALHDGHIRQTAIHGDTKIENFLFCRDTGRVKSLVDLDTIMPFTWLADWGDMMRSLCNVAGEREADPAKIQVDRGVYEAVTRGFLSTAREVTPGEIALMVDAVQIIALELGLRFLTDYLRGDTYFALGPGDPPDLNRIRGIAQLKLYERLLDAEEWTRACVRRYADSRA